MSSPVAGGKKRKRSTNDVDGAGPSANGVTLRLASQEDVQLGPVLGEFHTPNPPNKLGFKLKCRKLTCKLLFIFLLASFPALNPPTSTGFSTFVKKESEKDKKNKKDKPSGKVEKSKGTAVPGTDTIIVGETDAVEFVTSPESAGASAGCRYVSKSLSFIPYLC